MTCQEAFDTGLRFQQKTLSEDPRLNYIWYKKVKDNIAIVVHNDFLFELNLVSDRHPNEWIIHPDDLFNNKLEDLLK